MRITKCVFVCLVIAAVVLCTNAQTRQNKTQTQPAATKKDVASAASASQERATEMQHATPSAVHDKLAGLAGEYTTTTRFFMQPGAPPQETSGEAKLWMTLDGRFLTEENTGMFMGQPLKGFRILGYNNASNRYEGIWTYTMSTAIMTLNGTSKDAGRTVTLTAIFDGEGGAKQRLSVTLKRTDDDHFIVELVATLPDGKPGPRLETAYTRKKVAVKQ